VLQFRKPTPRWLLHHRWPNFLLYFHLKSPCKTAEREQTAREHWVLYPLSYWPAGSQENRSRICMSQVGFEPTSSRVVSEVTLPFTTSNFFAFRQIRAGRKIEQSSVATAAHRLTDEVTLLRTIPAS
jgi:hypothetical protein